MLITIVAGTYFYISYYSECITIIEKICQKNISLKTISEAKFNSIVVIDDEINEYYNCNTFSKGKTQPLASNATEEGRTKNRRTLATLNQ